MKGRKGRSGLINVGFGIREIWVQRPVLPVPGLVTLSKEIKDSMARFPNL